MNQSEPPPPPPVPDEPPPFLGSWSRVYIVVLIYLFLLIAAMYLFSQAVAG